MAIQNLLRTNENIGLFGEKKILFVTALDHIKSRSQIKQQRLLLTCPSISELPSSSAMDIRRQHTYPHIELRMCNFVKLLSAALQSIHNWCRANRPKPHPIEEVVKLNFCVIFLCRGIHNKMIRKFKDFAFKSFYYRAKNHRRGEGGRTAYLPM